MDLRDLFCGLHRAAARVRPGMASRLPVSNNNLHRIPRLSSQNRRSASTKAAPTAVGKSLQLPDGRQLGYHEFGDPAGEPVIYIHGTPDSGVVLTGFAHSLAKRLGVRWIAPDRPGIGLSTLCPNRRVLEYPNDLRRLIQHLKLDKYRLLGVSGGTGYTLACAQQLPRDELLAVGICAGIGPWEAGLEGQGPINEMAMRLWHTSPELMVAELNKSLVPVAQDPDPRKTEEWWRESLNKFEAHDRAVLSGEEAFQNAVRVYRQVYAEGSAAHAEEMRLVTQPWGLELEKVDHHGVMLWYGGLDVNTPPQMGRHLAERLPGAIYKEYPGESHYSIWREELVSGFLKELLRKGSEEK